MFIDRMFFDILKYYRIIILVIFNILRNFFFIIFRYNVIILENYLEKRL